MYISPVSHKIGRMVFEECLRGRYFVLPNCDVARTHTHIHTQIQIRIHNKSLNDRVQRLSSLVEIYIYKKKGINHFFMYETPIFLLYLLRK